MKQLRSKSYRIKLNATRYRELHRQILERALWRCQARGGMRNLRVYHRERSSRAGDDEETNLITLCARCHSAEHAIGTT